MDFGHGCKYYLVYISLSNRHFTVVANIFTIAVAIVGSCLKHKRVF